MLPGVLTVLLVTIPVRPFSEERLLLDRRLETLRRVLPDGAHPAHDAALVTELGRGARLFPLEVIPRAPLETATKGEVLLDLVAHGRFADVDRFFRQVALSPRLIDVDTLTLSASPGDLIKVTALLRLPYRPGRAPLPPPPEGVAAGLGDVPRPAREAYLRDQALAVAKSDTIATLRRARRNPRLFLSELAAVVRDRPVVLRDAVLGEEFLVRGVAVGEGPVRALETRLERGFFRIAEMIIVRNGPCRRFEVRGRCPVVGLEAEIPLPADDPFEQADERCIGDRDTGAATVVRNAAPSGKAARGKTPARATAIRGPLSLRLRDVDVADAFLALHRTSGQPFVVDDDVRGRLHVELDGVTLEDAQAALLRTGLRLSSVGRIRRVSRGLREVRDVEVVPEGDRAQFTLKRAQVRDVLTTIGEADPSFAAALQGGPLGAVSVWAAEVSVGEVRRAVLESAGLIEELTDGKRSVRRADEPAATTGAALAVRTPRLLLSARDVSVQEFELAGLAAAESSWIALAYAPTGALHAYRAGDRLADAVVSEVSSTDVLLTTEEGPLRLALRPLPR